MTRSLSELIAMGPHTLLRTKMNSKTDRERQIRKGVQVGGEPGGGPPGSSYGVRETLYRDAIVICTGEIWCLGSVEG